MTNLEGCTCWSSCCDLGPHSCICGNDCKDPHLLEGEAMSKFDHLRGMVDGQRKWGNTHVPISLETLTELLDIVESRPDKARFRTIVDEALNPSWVDGTEYSIGHPDELADVIYQAMAQEGELSNGSQG